MTEPLTVADRLRAHAASGLIFTLNNVTPDDARMIADACEGKPFSNRLRLEAAARRHITREIQKTAERQALLLVLIGAAAGACLIAMGAGQ